MLEKFKNQEIARCDKVIESYQVDIDALEQSINELKEQYKKVFEEIDDTQEVIDMYRESQAEWENKKRVLLGEIVEEPKPVEAEKKPRKRRTRKEEVPAAPADADKVIDTIYPENNEEEAVEEAAEEETVEEAASGSGSSDLFEEIWPEESNDVPAEESEEEAVVEETTEEPTEDAETKTAEVDGLIIDDNWPEFPEEWK